MWFFLRRRGVIDDSHQLTLLDIYVFFFTISFQFLWPTLYFKADAFGFVSTFAAVDIHLSHQVRDGGGCVQCTQ